MATQTSANAGATPTITFTARGLELDTRLMVFDTEFHVHSVILKMHSAFFFKFMDSPDKAGNVNSGANSSSTEITKIAGAKKYEWTTKIDESGLSEIDEVSWSLVGSASELATVNNKPITFDYKTKHTAAFHKLLCAFYQKAYRLEWVEELKLITQLADYCCALPTVSHSLTAPLYQGSLHIFGHYPSLINVAWKLRHAELFRECVIFLAGNWFATEAEEDIKTLHPRLQKVVLSARGRITGNMVNIQEEMLRRRSGNQLFHRHLNRSLSEEERMPTYYRSILDDKDLNLCEFPNFGLRLFSLMSNGLNFDRDRKRLQAGE